MTALAPTLQAFFTTRLTAQRQVSPRTIHAYRDAFRLLLSFIADRDGTPPADLDVGDLDATTISSFLDHLETYRHNSARTRNARLTAIQSFFRFAAYRHPEHAESIAQVLAIPTKRHPTASVTFLTPNEIDALVAAPDTATWNGRRDHTLLTLALHTGLRLAELTGLRRGDLHLDPPAHVSCTGKGRRHRDTPLGPDTVKVLTAWVAHHPGADHDYLFTSRRGGPLSPDAVQRLVTKHATTAQQTCPSLTGKHVTPHTLRHTCAMELLRHDIDITVIALWLGHERLQSTQTYLHADLAIKQRALDRTRPDDTTPAGRYQPPDRLLAFLQSL